jgi:hypothetical protein
MSGLNNATQDSTGSNVFEFPNPTSPFTHHQQYALEGLRQGRSVTAIMEDLRYERQTFYDWRNNNPAFKLATEAARDEFRGVVADCIHDLQQAVHVLLDDCIRTDRVPLNLRLRSAALFLRYAHSETLLPRRLVAPATAPNGISPSAPNTGPASPTPFPNQNPKPGEPEANKLEATRPKSATSPLHRHNADKTVRSVRLESVSAKPEAPKPETSGPEANDATYPPVAAAAPRLPYIGTMPTKL